MRFRNLKLALKQSIGFGFVLIILIGTNVYTVRQMAALKSDLDDVTNSWLPRAIAISISTSTPRSSASTRFSSSLPGTNRAGPNCAT